jgi:cell division septation protein DedD
MIKLHLDCSRRVGSKLANPYRDVDNGFHITFYEKVESLSDKESWKTGHLKKAGDPKGKQQKFRESAFTVSSLSLDKSEQVIRTRQMLATGEDRYWTMLLLSPPKFFEKPLETRKWKTGPGKEWKKVGSQPNKLSAEIACIVYALKEVVSRWIKLNEYISELLMENFMDPEAYDKLLFDDENFTRSKLYFWIIGCLNEFDVSIEDNIKQWELFREARVIEAKLNAKLDAKPHTKPDTNLDAKPDAKPDTKPDTKPDAKPDAKPVAKLGGLEQFQALLKEADNLRDALQDLRSQFQNKLTTVRALRDGVSCILIVSFLYSTCPS